MQTAISRPDWYLDRYEFHYDNPGYLSHLFGFKHSNEEMFMRNLLVKLAYYSMLSLYNYASRIWGKQTGLAAGLLAIFGCISQRKGACV